MLKNLCCVTFLLCSSALTTAAKASTIAQPACRQAVLEGEIVVGQSYEKPFVKDFEFGLEALPSGWIVRVLRTDEPRGAHDYAELASPPYQSVSPLLISTDWAFRAQDAVAWNPRRFQYAGSKAVFQQLSTLQPKVLEGDVSSSAKASVLVSQQPAGTLQILDAVLVPGTADQAQMASVVALHLATTPHRVDTSAAPTKLGRLEQMRFRVTLELPQGSQLIHGVHVEPCNGEPTGIRRAASHQSRTRTGK